MKDYRMTSNEKINISLSATATVIIVPTLYNVCSVHQGDTMSTSGGYHEYIGGGGGGVFSTPAGYHDACGGIS